MGGGTEWVVAWTGGGGYNTYYLHTHLEHDLAPDFIHCCPAEWRAREFLQQAPRLHVGWVSSAKEDGLPLA